MSVLPVGFGSSGGSYSIANSLRLRASASAYLSRTFGTPTNNTTWSFSAWMKIGALGTTRTILAATSDNLLYFNASNQLSLYEASVGVRATSTALYRDPSAHGHLLVRSNGTNIKGYWNNEEVFSYTGTIPPFNSAVVHRLGSYTSAPSNHLDGYLSDVYFIDGQALTPSSFGETNSDGVWVPKAYTGTYGNNGFHLDFKDAALTAGSNVGLGKDVSGNGNYWNTNNISVTAGVTYDSMVDTPTNNYAVMSPIASALVTFSAANLEFTTSLNGTPQNGYGSVGMRSGKWYFEVQPTSISTNNSIVMIGICGSTANTVEFYSQSTGYAYRGSGERWNNGSGVAYGSALSVNDVIGVAFDADAGTLTFYRNNTTMGTAYSSIPAGAYVAAVTDTGASNQWSGNINFGQRPFTYTPPTGFEALSTANLPAVAITDPSEHHNVYTVTKSGNTNFTLDWDASVYDTYFEIKRRDASGDWYNVDGLRGYDKIIKSNSTAAETTDANVISVSGTTCTLKSTLTDGTYVISAWKAGLTASRQTNTDGSITSTVSRNVTSGFAIVTHTGTGANATVGHGLGVASKMVISKNRTVASGWRVWHTGIANTEVVYLNAANAKTTETIAWNSTSPTSTVVSLGASGDTNGSTNSQLLYVNAEIPGYSKFGSYVGNASTDGPNPNLGFKARWLRIKVATGIADNWEIEDTARSAYNACDIPLYANLSNLEAVVTPARLDILSNGFKIRSTNTGVNAAQTYIFRAFAEFPFGGSNVSPSPAR